MNVESAKMRRFWIGLIVFLFTTLSVIAQSCPTMEQAAVGETRVWCADIASGEACFGNNVISAEFASFAADDLSFSAPGHTIPLTDITSLSTAVSGNEYGVALIHTRGYVANSWDEEDVTLALLGDATLNNTGQEGIGIFTTTTTITSSAGANVRTGTSTDFRVLKALFEGDTVKITGRLDDGSWVRIQLPDGRSGWITTSAVDINLSRLSIVSPDTTQPLLLYPPFSSFSLQTSAQDKRCNDAWESGVLLQTDDENLTRIQVNNRTLLVSGTVFLQSPLQGDLNIFVIEGSVQIDDVVVEEGYQALISSAMDTTGDPFPPSVQHYSFARFASLPTEILPRYTYIGIDLSIIITPAPITDRSPIIDTLVTDPCVITTGDGGANLRAGPSSDFMIRGVLGFRETVNPIARTTDSSGVVWYELAQNVWVVGSVVVTGGDCIGLPQSTRIPNLLPTATPEN